jgi:hypothetical protein
MSEEAEEAFFHNFNRVRINPLLLIEETRFLSHFIGDVTSNGRVNHALAMQSSEETSTATFKLDRAIPWLARQGPSTYPSHFTFDRFHKCLLMQFLGLV